MEGLGTIGCGCGRRDQKRCNRSAHGVNLHRAPLASLENVFPRYSNERQLVGAGIFHTRIEVRFELVACPARRHFVFDSFVAVTRRAGAQMVYVELRPTIHRTEEEVIAVGAAKVGLSCRSKGLRRPRELYDELLWTQGNSWRKCAQRETENLTPTQQPTEPMIATRPSELIILFAIGWGARNPTRDCDSFGDLPPGG